MSTKHTPEPWFIESYSAKTWIASQALCIGNIICDPPDPDAEESFAMWPANAERIVSCVNALAGIIDPATAIQAARDALEKMRSIHPLREFSDEQLNDISNEPDLSYHKSAMALLQTRQALALLTHKP